MTAERLVLHSSPSRLALSIAAPVMLLALGGSALLEQVSPVPIVLTVLGLVLGWVVLFDLPVRTEFDRTGLTRVCLGRRHRYEWDEVIAVVRSPALTRTSSLLGRRSRSSGPRRNQGLSARLGPRRVSLLVDRLESHAEYDVLRTILADTDTMLRAAEPPLDSKPAGRGPTALHNRAD